MFNISINCKDIKKVAHMILESLFDFYFFFDALYVIYK